MDFTVDGGGAWDELGFGFGLRVGDMGEVVSDISCYCLGLKRISA